MTQQAGPPWGGQPPVGHPAPPPPREAAVPRRVESVPGTPFGLVYLTVPPATSGPAVGALAAGIGSVVVSMLVLCFGVSGAEAGWGAWVAGAFTMLGGLAGAAAILLGVLGRRQISRPAPPPGIRFTGRGLATAGIGCGATGLGLTLAALLLAVALQVGAS